MRAVNIHALSITALAVTNVILVVQNVRWLIYAQPIRTQLPFGHLSYRFDPMLEAPAILLGIGVAYFLLYKVALNIWRIRRSEFQHGLMTRALLLNSVVLLVMTALGTAQWLVFFGYVPLDIPVISSLGALAAGVSLYMEKRLHRNDHFSRSRSLLPLGFLHMVAGVWERSHRSTLAPLESGWEKPGR